MLKKYEDILRQSYFFRGLDSGQRGKVIQCFGGKTEAYKKGQMIFQEGERITDMGIVLMGEVCLVRIDLEGQERLFQKLEASYMLGADVVCTPSRECPYTAYCSKDTVVWTFAWPDMEKEEWREWGALLKTRYLEFIANENIRKFYRIDILSSKSVRTRILKYLRIQCSKQKSCSVAIPYSREEFANYLCVNRSVLSDELSKMQAEGILLCRKNYFTILKEEFLPI